MLGVATYMTEEAIGHARHHGTVSWLAFGHISSWLMCVPPSYVWEIKMATGQNFGPKIWEPLSHLARPSILGENMTRRACDAAIWQMLGKLSSVVLCCAALYLQPQNRRGHIAEAGPSALGHVPR